MKQFVNREIPLLGEVRFGQETDRATSRLTNVSATACRLSTNVKTLTSTTPLTNVRTSRYATSGNSRGSIWLCTKSRPRNPTSHTIELNNTPNNFRSLPMSPSILSFTPWIDPHQPRR